MKQLAMVVTVLLCSSGCMSRYRRANELAEQGKFVEAAELFEQLAREQPNDSDLPKLMQRARYRAIDHALERARKFRLTEDPKTSQQWFAEGLKLRSRWNVKLNGALEQTIEDEREDATLRLRALVFPHTQIGEALTAEALIESYRFLLQHPELSALSQELTAAAVTAGQGTCARLRPSATAPTPYWTSLVARYCQHFRTASPREYPLPDTFRPLQMHAQISRLSEGLTGQLEEALREQAHRGPWFSEQGPLSAVISARGGVGVTHADLPVRLSAEWRERVPYIEHVTKTLEETVPVTECETYEESTFSNQGGGKVQRVREVTREKTKKKEVVVPETRYRDVPRAFEYQALRVERTTSFAARAELSISGQPAAAAGHESSDAEWAYHHDVTFTPANVYPKRPQFVAVETWMSRRAEELTAAFAASMREGWRARFCKEGAFSVEQGARCARAVEAVPSSALQALEPALGADAVQVPRLLTPQ